MEAYLEITDWGNAKTPNHTYLLSGANLVAYIKQGETDPFYFKNPIKGFDKRGRKFELLKANPFEITVSAANIRQVTGSKGEVYTIDLDAKTCTCAGYTFRGTCKHTKDL